MAAVQWPVTNAARQIRWVLLVHQRESGSFALDSMFSKCLASQPGAELGIDLIMYQLMLVVCFPLSEVLGKMLQQQQLPHTPAAL